MAISLIDSHLLSNCSRAYKQAYEIEFDETFNSI